MYLMEGSSSEGSQHLGETGCEDPHEIYQRQMQNCIPGLTLGKGAR